MATTQSEQRQTKSAGRFAKAVAAFVVLAGLALPNANAAFLETTTAFSPPTIFAPGFSEGISNEFTTQGDTFLDHYTFTLGGSGVGVGNVMTLDIANIFNLDFHPATSGMYTGGGALVSPSVIVVFGPGHIALTFAALAGGDYDFRVGGAVFGTGGGSYGGQLQVVTAAIPEPEIYAMMAAGLGLMGFVARRRKGRTTA